MIRWSPPPWRSGCRFESRNPVSILQYYLVKVKIRNQTEPLPDTLAGEPSPLSSIFEYRLFVRDSEILEKSLDFSFDVFFEENSNRLTKLVINGNDVTIDKCAVWDDDNAGYYYQLFFELWIYDIATSDFQFHNRYVQFWLNMSS